VPHAGTNILVINPVAKTFTTFGTFTGANKYNGAVLAPNGRIYSIPFDIDNVLIINPSDNSTSTITAPTGKTIASINIPANWDYYGVDNVSATKQATTIITEGFQVKWDGIWTPQTNGTQYITAPADDGVILKLDGEVVINDWVDKGGGGSTADVQTTAVIVREDTPGDQRLVAYVVITPNSQATSGDLRQFLANQLPTYLVPNTFVILDSLPLTPNGKCDRRSLPAPDDQARKNIQKIAPRNVVELQLTQIWSEVLGINDLSVEENFFELGGHSLLATQVISRLRENLSLELPLRYLFEQPTIEDLAIVVTEIQTTLQRLQTPIDPLSTDREEIEL
jgi:acyl carrier protein